MDIHILFFYNKLQFVFHFELKKNSFRNELKFEFYYKFITISFEKYFFIIIEVTNYLY